MAFCAKCGASLAEGSGFCGSCGTPVGTATAGTAGTTPAATTSGLDSNIGGLMTYVPFVGWIISIVFLVIEPYNKDKFVRFHAFQSIFFTVAAIILRILLGIVAGIFANLSSGLGWLIWGPIEGLLWLAVLALSVLLMYKAYNRERFMLPFIGDLAAKQAG